MISLHQKWKDEIIRLVYSDELPDDTPVSEIRRIATERTGWAPGELANMSTMPEDETHKNLPCLRCDRNLWVQTAVNVYGGVQRLQCECGLLYDANLLRRVNHEEWGRIIRRDGFEVNFEGDTAWVTHLAE